MVSVRLCCLTKANFASRLPTPHLWLSTDTDGNGWHGYCMTNCFPAARATPTVHCAASHTGTVVWRRQPGLPILFDVHFGTTWACPLVDDDDC
jgi:hypothetical protein